MSDTYITRSELRNPPYSITTDDANNTFLEVLQDLTKSMIDKMCFQNFELEGTTEVPIEYKVNGTGKDTIFLPKRLVSLSKIYIYSNSTNYVEYAASNFVEKPKYISWNIYSETYTSFRFRVEDFELGNANIGVWGTWGYASIPDPIKYLQGRLIQKILTDKAFAQKFSSERIEDFSYNLIADKDRITGDFELDLIIKHHRVWLTYGTYNDAI